MWEWFRHLCNENNRASDGMNISLINVKWFFSYYYCHDLLYLIFSFLIIWLFKFYGVGSHITPLLSLLCNNTKKTLSRMYLLVVKCRCVIGYRSFNKYLSFHLWQWCLLDTLNVVLQILPLSFADVQFLTDCAWELFPIIINRGVKRNLVKVCRKLFPSEWNPALDPKSCFSVLF
jgi:hypothetical protein